MTKKKLEEKISARELILAQKKGLVSGLIATMEVKDKVIMALRDVKIPVTPKHMACGFQFSPGHRVYGTKEAITQITLITKYYNERGEVTGQTERTRLVESGSINGLFDNDGTH